MIIHIFMSEYQVPVSARNPPSCEELKAQLNEWEEKNRPRFWVKDNCSHICQAALKEMRDKFSDAPLSTFANRGAFKSCVRNAFNNLYLKECDLLLDPDASKIKLSKYQTRSDAIMRLFSDGTSFPHLRLPNSWDIMMENAGFDSNQQTIFREQVCPFKFVLHSNRNT